MAPHSWELPDAVPPPSAVPGHSWEPSAERCPEDDGDVVNWADCSDDEYTAEEASAGAELVSLLLQHMLYSRLTAAQVCILMYWADKCGISKAKPYALRPGA